MFTSIITTGNLNLTGALICTGVAILCGLVIAKVYMITGNHNRNFATSLVLLPVLVEVVVLMVNGSLGAGVAILGAFSLVRFRSVPGTSRDICSLFFAMAVGLTCGMGYIAFAIALTFLLSLVWMILAKIKFGEVSSNVCELRITIPENLDYDSLFDEIFERFLHSHQMERIKTTNLGSLFELFYTIKLKDRSSSKEFMDEVRSRNGNLPVILSRPNMNREEL